MKRILLIVISVLILNSFDSRAQKIIPKEKDPIFYYGFYAGLNLNMHSADFPKLADYENCCPKFESGNGTGFSIGAYGELPLSEIIAPYLRLGYTTLDANFAEEELIGNTENVVSTQDGDIEDVYSEHSIDSKISIIAAEPGVNFYLFEGFNLNAGLRLGFTMNSTFSQAEEVTRPGYVVFKENMQRSRNVYDDEEIPEAAGLLMHLGLGAGYDLPIGKNSYISPEVRYYMALNDVLDVSWKPNQVHIGALLKLPVMPPKEVIIIRDTIIRRDTTTIEVPELAQSSITKIDEFTEEKFDESGSTQTFTTIITEKYERQIPRDAALSAELTAVGINADGTRQENPTIIIEEIETEETFPLLPHVFFEGGSSDLSKSNLHLLTSPEAARFDEDNLEWNTMEIYRDLLNIVGYRMTQNGSANITLTGTNNNTGEEAGNTGLSMKRAEAVKSYLVDSWGIEPDRIRTLSRNLPQYPANNERPDGREENSRVEIEATSGDILKPVSLKEILRKSNPPVVEIDPKVMAEGDIENWQLAISQDNESLREESGSGFPEKYRWEVEEEPLPKLEEPVVISLSADDSYGQNTSAQKELTIEQLTIRKKRFELKDDKRIEKFALILFDFDEASIKPRHRTILDDIKSRIKPNSTVTIEGYADRSGEQEYNKELAARRTQEVTSYLGSNLQEPEIINYGSDKLLYDNSTPQGRSYSRTVVITIATPVE
jgi:outer membrane protein OmpA-like peptidoglycan-associated protein